MISFLLENLRSFSRRGVFFPSVEDNAEKALGYKGLPGRFFSVETPFQEETREISGVFIDTARLCSSLL